MANKITPQTLPGFRDFLPEEMKIREQVINVFKKVFASYGYEPLETPALEYAETLLGKYGEEGDKLIYQFKDPGKRRVAMKYDLSVPLARVISQYVNQLPLPFKRYQIQPVWRADKPQKGRFREFYQCDADTVGTASMIADGEFIQMCTDLFQNLGFNDFVTRINNRKLINGLVKYAGANNTQFYDIVVSIDKLEKIGLKGVENELRKRKIPQSTSKKILELIKIKETSKKLLKIMQEKLSSIPEALTGIKEIEQIFAYLQTSSVPEKYYCFDPSIVRGLAYYTGPVWETVILEGKVGSVTGCGRYDKLIGMFLGRDIPATGGSFGLERIVEIIKDRQMLKPQKSSTQVLVTIFSPEYLKKSIEVVTTLRFSNIVNTELYPDPEAKLDKQLKYADRKGIPYAIIIGPKEAAKNIVSLKNLRTKTQKTLPLEKLTKSLLE